MNVKERLAEIEREGYLAALRGEYQELQLAVQQIMEGENST